MTAVTPRWHANPKGAKQAPHVVHVVPALFGKSGVVGGAERYAYELARHMADVTPTTLVSFGERPSVETAGRLRVVVLGRPWFVRGQRSNPFALGLIRRLAEADVVHCHQQHIVASSVAAAFGRLSGRRVFVSDLGGGGWDVSGYVSTDRWFRGHLHISEYSRRVKAHAGRPWAHVIYGGVDPELFSPDPAVPRDGSVLFVGRLLPHKGVDTLIEAAPTDLPLEILGTPYHERFYQDLQRLAQGKRVRFRHGCSDAEVVASYRRATCVVLPSVYRDRYGGDTAVPELLGQTLLEGMACGTPAVCTEVASMPEVVADGETGFVVPPNDPAALREKLVWLRERPDAVRALGEAARRHVLERFTWPAVVRRCLRLYRGE